MTLTDDFCPQVAPLKATVAFYNKKYFSVNNLIIASRKHSDQLTARMQRDEVLSTFLIFSTSADIFVSNYFPDSPFPSRFTTYIVRMQY